MTLLSRWRCIAGISLCMLLVCTTALTSRVATASTTNIKSCALSLPANEKWLPQEVWAWNNICQGKAAHLNTYKNRHDCLTAEAEKWPESSWLTARFIETLVRNPRYRETLKDSGLQIYCAKIENQLKLANLNLEFPLLLSNMWLAGGADLSDLRTNSTIDMQFTRSDGFFNARNIKVAGDLLFNSATLEDMDIANGIFQSNVTFELAKIKTQLNAERIKVNGYLWLNYGEYDTVNIVSANIGNGLILTGSKLTGELRAWFTTIDKGPAYCDKAEFNKVSMQFAKFSPLLDLSESTIKGFFNANRLTVNGNLMLSGVKLSDGIDLSFAEITHDLELSRLQADKEINADSINVHGSIGLRDAKFKDMFMISAHIGKYMIVTGSQINGEFNLSNAKIKDALILGSVIEPVNIWGKDAFFSLYNTSVGLLQDTSTSWELTDGNLDINGFEYATAITYGSGAGNTITERPIDWLISWLGKQNNFHTTFNPQPYELLASELNKLGQQHKAIEILMAKNERQRNNATTPYARKIWMTISWLLIGYGYKEWRALIWLGCLIVLGIIVLSRSPAGKQHNLIQRLIFSFDVAIPIIHFNSKRTEEILTNLDINSELYFHVHKILGFILVTFAAAGLSGLVH